MARGGFIARHKVAIASNAALVMAASAVVGYAITADGYQAHQAQLNDGGIWVVHGEKGIYGRINKPINQLDAIVFGEGGSERPLDVVQDGAAVAAIDRKAATAQVVDPQTAKLDSSGKISIPSDGDQQLAGGTFASLDAETGALWAVQLDPQRGRPQITSLDAQADPLEKVGQRAALAVTQGGTVVATSAEKGTITFVAVEDGGLGDPSSDDLPSVAGDPTSVTTVGERVVTLDEDTGGLAVLDGASATVPLGSVLQQSGPEAGSVLVATPDSLLRVDLDSGRASVVDEGHSGTPSPPVRLGACSYGAWSGGRGTVSVQCGQEPPRSSGLGGKATNLTFRVNRGQIVLNDGVTGAVWDLESPEPEKIDNWNAFTMTRKVKDKDKKDAEQSVGDKTPPEAKPDRYGARPGRVSVLHPLDNDSAPKGRLLSIVDVDDPGGGATVRISPDGQTLVLDLPDKARDTSFDYYINDGRTNFSAQATVTVDVREGSVNQAPGLRKGYKPRMWRVPANGIMSVPVLADWRDDRDSDALSLASATIVGAAEGGAQARTTADGRVRFTGSREGGERIQVEYAVSDGRSAPVATTLTFDVQERLDRQSFPPVAEPDVVRGEVGTPIEIRPLLNDLPGSDPGTPNAELALGGKIPAQSGIEIRSELETGVITVTGKKPGTYFLDYDARYGNAPIARSAIRVDVQPKPRTPGDPVAMPDTLTLFGQSAGVIDVLANDLDPAGGLLVVQGAEALAAGQLDVTVIDGRWVRVSAKQGELPPTPHIVRYTISNGATSGIEGEISVTHRPRPEDDAPVTTTDRVTVRAGTSVTVPVLDNDISPSGDRLTLVADAATQGKGAATVPGELEIDRPVDVEGDLGTAYVSGRSVRYVAPDLEQRDSYEMQYVARNTAGDTAPGRLVVVITPAGAGNEPPEPPTLEGRLVSGETIKVRVPGSGIDPDGDPVTVVGITSAPRLGRVLSYGGNFLEYQAYPRTTGTDEFEYSIVDSRGAVATGVVRVAVVPPGEPQPPLAVADQLTVEPGRTAIIDPLANDFHAPGDDISIELRDPPAGVELDPDTQLVSVPTPDDLRTPVPDLVYEISNGIDTSIATIEVDLADSFNNPPVVHDAFGEVADSASVSVDVLEGAYDPDGRTRDLRLVRAFGTEGSPTINGAKLKVDRGPNPIVVPFRVEDADGAAASASLYVPPTGTGIPYVKPGALIEVPVGGSVKGKLSDYVVNPSRGDVRLVGRDAVSASPSQLDPSRSGDDSFEISAGDGFRGPGALLVRVTTAIDESGNEDPQDATDGYTALLSIPVQVGDDTPVLECPQTTIPISAGQTYDLDIASLCNVWTADPAEAATLDYRGEWTQSVDGLSVAGNGSPVLRVSADDGATGGGEGVLAVTAGDSAAAQIRFRLAKAPPPTMLPIRVDDMEAGQSRELDLARYLQSEIADPDPTVVSVATLTGAGVSASASGGSRITLRAGPGAKGRAVFRVVMSDVADSNPASGRTAEARIEFEVAGTPGAPSQPVSYVHDEKGTVRLGWYAPKDDGGSPITKYVVKEVKSGRTLDCRTTDCDFPGLKNARQYAFRVAAVNKVGQGPFSDQSKTAFADTPPGRVGSITMIGRGDGTITVGWKKPESSTDIEQYRLSWLGGSVAVDGGTNSYTVTGLDNNKKYVFAIEALNSVGWSGVRESEPLQPIGTPMTPGGLEVTDLQSGVASTDLRANWSATLPEGPAPTLYTLSYTTPGKAASAVPGCARIQATSCIHGGRAYDGTVYSYTVRAHNAKNSSPVSNPVTFEAVGKPSAWGSWQVGPTGADNRVRVTATAPEPRGRTARAAILVAGQVVWENNVTPGAIINEIVPTPSNETTYPVQLRMCNENAPTGCTFSADTKSVQSYGPLSGHLAEITSTTNGMQISWTVSGTSNGDPASLRIAIDGGAPETVGLPGPGRFSLQRSVTATDYDQAHRIEVWLVDSAPSGRGEDYEQMTARSGPPPPPRVLVARGAACQDGTANPCRRSATDIWGPCEEDTCARVRIHLVDWRAGQVTCWVSASEDARFRFLGESQKFNPAATPVDTGWFTNGRYIQITCEAGGIRASGAVLW